jgi:putative ABC transport system permease protein
LTANVTGQNSDTATNFPGQSNNSTPNTSLTAPTSTVTVPAGAGNRFGGQNNAGSTDSSGNSTFTVSQRMNLLGVSGASSSENTSIVTNYLSSNSSTTSAVSLSSGAMISGNTDSNEVVIGDQLANANNLKVGDTFMLYDTTVTVVGIVSSDNSDTVATQTAGRGGAAFARNGSTGTMIIASLLTVQTLTAQSGSISQIVATVDNINNVSSVSTAIQNQFGNDSSGNATVDVRSQLSNSQTIIDGFNQQKDSIKSVGTTALMSLVAAVVAAAAIIFLAMLMIVRERRNEIGVLKAIGAKSRVIITQFVAESLVLTMLAAVIGLGVGVVAATPLTDALMNSATSSSNASTNTQRGPRNFGSAVNRGLSNVTKVTANVDWTIVIWALGSAIVIAAVGATAASLVAMRVRPAEAVRAE